MDDWARGSRKFTAFEHWLRTPARPPLNDQIDQEHVRKKRDDSEGEIGSILSDIGHLARGQAGTDLAELLLYAEIEEGMIAPSLFIGRDDKVEYAMPDRTLYMRLYDLWHAAPEDEKSGSITYDITGDKFHVEFSYPDDWVGGRFHRRPAKSAASKTLRRTADQLPSN